MKRIDETGDDDGVESANYRVPNRAARFGPRLAHGTSAAQASSSRDSPDIERTSGTAQRFQIWVMSPFQIEAGANAPQTTPRKFAVLT
jgi:hypothetical protein